MSDGGEEREGVSLTNLDQPLFDGAEATKRDLVDYLDAVADRIVPELRDRPLSVVRVRSGQEPFMQKNVPKYTPPWVRTVPIWAAASKREVSYALCNDRRTLLWFANQRAVEYHPTLFRVDRSDRSTHLVLDLDPPAPDEFPLVVRAAELVRQAITDVGLAGAVKTSGAKGVHIFVPVDEQATVEEVAAATRAIAARAERLDPGLATTAFVKDDRGGKVFLDSTRAGGATVVAAYSPRVQTRCPGVVPARVGRPRPCCPGRLHRAHGGATPRRRRSVGHRHAGAATPGRRVDRGGQGDPHRPGASDARGQTAGPGTQRLTPKTIDGARFSR